MQKPTGRVRDRVWGRVWGRVCYRATGRVRGRVRGYDPGLGVRGRTPSISADCLFLILTWRL